MCAITGSNGYVGGCVKNYFAARGWEILELTRRPKPGARGVAVPTRRGYFRRRSLAGVDALVHCAYDFKPLRWDEIRAVNVEGSRKIFAGGARGGRRENHLHFLHQRLRRLPLALRPGETGN